MIDRFLGWIGSARCACCETPWVTPAAMYEREARGKRAAVAPVRFFLCVVCHDAQQSLPPAALLELGR